VLTLGLTSQRHRKLSIGLGPVNTQGRVMLRAN
jgi:hypothetical protein